MEVKARKQNKGLTDVFAQAEEHAGRDASWAHHGLRLQEAEQTPRGWGEDLPREEV